LRENTKFIHFNTSVPLADVVDGLIVEHKVHVGVVQEGMGGQDSVVRLNNSSGHQRRRVDRVGEAALLGIVCRQTFQKKRRKTTSSTTSNGVCQEAVISKNKNQIHEPCVIIIFPRIKWPE
jgi:hypothetical protein